MATEIWTAADLDNVRNNLSGSYIQMADIDLSGYANWVPIGDPEQHSPWSYFNGSYDGNGFTISNLTCNNPGAFGNDAGLFEQIESGATLKNITILNASVSGADYLGILAGHVGSQNYYATTTIQNCHVQGTVAGSGGATGLLIGAVTAFWYNEIVNISDCTCEGSVSGTDGNAGLVGDMRVLDTGVVTINKCSCNVTATGITGDYRDQIYTGGLIGYMSVYNANSLVEISESFTTGSATGKNSIGGFIGGVNCGDEAVVNIHDCYAQVNTTATESVWGCGGLIGEVWPDNYSNLILTNCYSTGLITGVDACGGLLGYVDTPFHITNCFYDSETSGQSDTGKGAPKTTAEMKTESTFYGWDFDDVWNIYTGVYPFLSFELSRQTCKRYAEIAECLSSDPDMTMSYNGKYYKFLGFLEEFTVTTHPTTGISMTYEYGGLTVDYNSKDYLFVASGITDPDAPGGYSSYKSGNSRTVKSLAARENFVHFYYIEIANADISIKSPSEIKSANPMIILDAGVSYPIGAKYHFKLASYADSEAVTQIATVNSKDNPELFKYSLDEGITWVAFPAGGIANTNTKLLVATRVNVGPRSEVWILPSKELVVT